MTISIVNGVNPLQTTLLELGIVSGRVALLLRSAEIQPVFGRFSIEWHSPFSPSLYWRHATGRVCTAGAAIFQVPGEGVEWGLSGFIGEVRIVG